MCQSRQWGWPDWLASGVVFNRHTVPKPGESVTKLTYVPLKRSHTFQQCRRQAASSHSVILCTKKSSGIRGESTKDIHEQNKDRIRNVSRVMAYDSVNSSAK